MNCEWTEKISLLIDGELPDAESRALQRHLIDCSECQQTRGDFLNLRNQITSYVPSLNPAAQADALNRILGRQQAPVRVAPVSKWNWTWSFNPRVAAFASLILLAAILGFVVYRAVQHKDPAPIEVTKTNPAAAPAPVPSKEITQQQDRSNNIAVSQPAKPSPRAATPKRQRLERQTSNMVATNRATAEGETNANVAAVGAGDIQALTAIHLEKSELLLRAFRNVRTTKTGQSEEIAYERKQARQLIVRNMMLKREADVSGDVQISSLLENLEPILLDIANLPDRAAADDIRVINERVERKNIVALLQVNSTVLAKALDDDD